MFGRVNLAGEGQRASLIYADRPPEEVAGAPEQNEANCAGIPPHSSQPRNRYHPRKRAQRAEGVDCAHTRPADRHLARLLPSRETLLDCPHETRKAMMSAEI